MTLDDSGLGSNDAGRRIDAGGNIRKLLPSGGVSSFERYRLLTFPDGGLLMFGLYELACMLLLPLPGALGLWLRRKLLGPFFGRLGRDVIIGRNCEFRHPRRIFVGDAVALESNCMLDARGTGPDGLRLADGVIVGRGASIRSKSGAISIGRGVSIGGGTHIVSVAGVRIGDGAAIGGGCLIAGGTFPMSQFNRPLPERTPATTGPIEVGAGAWVAMGATIIDGVRIGENAIVSVGSVVVRSVRPRTIVQGNPARTIFEIR